MKMNEMNDSHLHRPSRPSVCSGRTCSTFRPWYGGIADSVPTCTHRDMTRACKPKQDMDWARVEASFAVNGLRRHNEHAPYLRSQHNIGLIQGSLYTLIPLFSRWSTLQLGIRLESAGGGGSCALRHLLPSPAHAHPPQMLLQWWTIFPLSGYYQHNVCIIMIRRQAAPAISSCAESRRSYSIIQTTHHG